MESSPGNLFIYFNLFTVHQICFHCRAVRARLTGVKDQYSCIKVPQFEVETEDVYLREVSTCDFITTSPQLRDPYETRWVEVRQSRVDGAEDGLFCRQNVKAGTVS